MKTSRRRKALGQHFLTNPRTADKIVALAGVTPQDTVLEIGPGKGILTEALLRAGCRVIAVEKDHSLAQALEERFAGDQAIKIHEADFLKFDLVTSGVGWCEQTFRPSLGRMLNVCEDDRTRPRIQQNLSRVKVVANLPYSVATEIIFKLIEHRRLFSTLHLMVQKEVADRLVAKPGGKDYGVLSIMTQLYSDSEIVMRLPPGAFHPPPKVHSAVVAMRLSDVPRVPIKDEDAFRRIVKQAFSSRRKMLKNALKIQDETLWREICKKLAIDPRVRAENLSLEQFAFLIECINHSSCDSV